MSDDSRLESLLERIAAALERAAPAPTATPDFASAEAFVWHGEAERFQPVAKVNRVPIALLKGIDRAASILLDNTRRFARGLPANNALLWGARGMGKSSLVKAVHAEVSGEESEGASGLASPLGERRARSAGEGAVAHREIAKASRAQPLTPILSPRGEGDAPAQKLKLVEIHREEIATLPACLAALRAAPHRFIVFCDDLSFDKDDASYKSLKAVLEGGIEGRPDNVIFYATSNRRHLMPREMVENERATAINPAEATEEKVSLSDRFGLWLGFHNASQDDYLTMVRSYASHFKLQVDDDALVRDSLEWSITRGARSGRVAWQFTQDLAGRLGKTLPA